MASSPTYACPYCAFNSHAFGICVEHLCKLHGHLPIKIKRLILSDKTGQLGYCSLRYDIVPDNLKQSKRKIGWNDDDEIHITKETSKKRKLHDYKCKYCEFCSSSYQDIIEHNLSTHKTEPLSILCLQSPEGSPTTYRSKHFNIIPAEVEANGNKIV